jgi:hypothetical protein
MKDKMGPLEETLKDSQDVMNGSDQERTALDKSYATQDKIQKELTQLQEQMIPAGKLCLLRVHIIYFHPAFCLNQMFISYAPL